MKGNIKTWGRIICGIAGAAFAYPGGALIGNLAGGVLASILPEASDFLSTALNKLSSHAIDKSSKALVNKLTPEDQQRINHDLQSAFRNAFLEAIYDIGGEHCFPDKWEDTPRDVPEKVIYSLTTEGNKLWLEKDPLAEQVCSFFHSMNNSTANGELLPLDPNVDKPLEDVQVFLEADTPRLLSDAFYNQVISPFITRYGSLIAELPNLKPHIQTFILDLTLIHLDEFLKSCTPSWRAYNRLMLEEVRNQIRNIDTQQTDILDRLDAILSDENTAAMATWSNVIADFLSATGQIEKKLDEGFDDILNRVIEQHSEVISQFEVLITSSMRIETKVDRVLRILEDGNYVIEGAPSVPIDEPPAEGFPPYKGLQYFDVRDSDLYYGRKLLISRLVRMITKPVIRQTDDKTWSGENSDSKVIKPGHFLSIVGASGSGKSSLIRAGLIPALIKGDGGNGNGLLSKTNNHWQVHIITPTAHPIESLAVSLTRNSESVSAASSLIDDLWENPKNLHLYVRKLLNSNQELNYSFKDKKIKTEEANKLLIYVDQFEELFTLCRDVKEREVFINNLLTAVSSEAAGPTVVIISLRADFYSDCAQFGNLRAALETHQIYLGPMDENDIRSVIEEPARRGGPDGKQWEFEPGLVDLILRDVGKEPGALPLLSHTLLETWKHRRGRTMTLEVMQNQAESGEQLLKLLRMCSS